MTFTDLKLDAQLIEGLETMGIVNPTPIQEQAIPLIFEGNDLIACAQTGTGKTAAFLLPVCNQLMTKNDGRIKCIIIVPTRELAIQIDNQLQGFAYFAGVSSFAVYGGGESTAWEMQKNAIKQGADIIIATPGRFLSHMNFGYMDLTGVEYLVLDEADRMLDMGFNEDITTIIKQLPVKKQSLFFSATMPKEIKNLANKFLRNHKEISIALSKPAEGILQGAYLVYDSDKIQLTQSLLKGKDLKSVIIFSQTKKNVKQLERELCAIGINAQSLHADLDQAKREEVLRDFKNHKFNVMVATDIVARGIDIENIDLVINYEVPKDAEDYVHRVGRTARAASTGVALTYINQYDVKDFMDIEKLIGNEVRKIALPPTIQSAPDYVITKSKPSFKGKSKFKGKRKTGYNKKRSQ